MGIYVYVHSHFTAPFDVLDLKGHLRHSGSSYSSACMILMIILFCLLPTFMFHATIDQLRLFMGYRGFGKRKEVRLFSFNLLGYVMEAQVMACR